MRMRLKTPIETSDPEGRGQGTKWTALPRLFLSLTVHCRSRSRTLQTLVVAMALAMSQPYRI